MIVGIIGAARSGKDTVAEVLVQNYGFERLGFSDPLKECAEAYFGWDGVKDARGRRLLQILGTDAGREYDPEVWIKWIDRHITHSLQTRWVLPDIRFDNEAEWVQKQGGYVVEVYGRGGLTNPVAAAHASEAGVTPSLITQRLNNQGTIKQLKDFVTEFMKNKF